MIKTFCDPYLSSNTYLVWDEDTHEGFVLDLGVRPETVKTFAQANGITVTALILSHGHYDHAYFAAAYGAHFPGVPLYCHEVELVILCDPQANVSALIGAPDVYPAPDKTLREGDTVMLGTQTWQVLHTPGHTPGCICLYNAEAKQMLTGDTLFADGGFGRFDFKYGDRAVLGASLSRLLSMDGDIVIYPGHGRASTIREEQRAMLWFERC